MGFFKPGEGHKAAAEGHTRLEGPKPINTSGGLKSKGHPVEAKIVGRITGVEAKNPESIRVGTPLKAEFIHRRQGPDEKTYLAFKP